MTPLSLGIFASANTTVNTSFESIATVSLSSSAASITFSSIPSTYTHLQVRLISFANYRTGIFPNNDTGTSYAVHFIYGNGSSAGAVGNANRNEGTFGPVPSSGTNPSSSVLDILDYANTNKYKTIRHLSGFDANGSGELWFGSVLWMNTSAITSLVIKPVEGGGNFAQYSHFALYGIKSA